MTAGNGPRVSKGFLEPREEMREVAAPPSPPHMKKETLEMYAKLEEALAGRPKRFPARPVRGDIDYKWLRERIKRRFRKTLDWLAR